MWRLYSPSNGRPLTGRVGGPGSHTGQLSSAPFHATHYLISGRLNCHLSLKGSRILMMHFARTALGRPSGQVSFVRPHTLVRDFRPSREPCGPPSTPFRSVMKVPHFVSKARYPPLRTSAQRHADSIADALTWAAARHQAAPHQAQIPDASGGLAVHSEPHSWPRRTSLTR